MHVWVKAYVYEQHGRLVRAGQEVHVTFPALPGRTLSGVVVHTSPTLEENERVLPVWVEVTNPDGILVEGILARVAIAVDAQGDSTLTHRATGQGQLAGASVQDRVRASEGSR